MNLVKQSKRWARDTYYQAARSGGALTPVHNRLRRWHHKQRYGVNTDFMFMAVELEINSMCNRKCTYCPNVTDRRPGGYMSRELFDKIIAELGEMDFDGRVSYHFYGEPLLDKRLPEFVEHTKKVVPKSFTEIYSNGDFLNLESFREYLRRGLDNMLITQHDNVMPENLQAILDGATEEEKKKIVIRFAEDRYMINRSGLITDLAVIKEPLKVACTWPLHTMVITIEGNVVLCCNDYFETEVIGNVGDTSLKEVWSTPQFQKFRYALSTGDRTVSKLCHECDFVPEEDQLLRVVPGR